MAWRRYPKKETRRRSAARHRFRGKARYSYKQQAAYWKKKYLDLLREMEGWV